MLHYLQCPQNDFNASGWKYFTLIIIKENYFKSTYTFWMPGDSFSVKVMICEWSVVQSIKKKKKKKGSIGADGGA